MKNTTSKKLSLQKFQVTKFHDLSKIMGGRKAYHCHKAKTGSSEVDTTKEDHTVQTPDTTQYR